MRIRWVNYDDVARTDVAIAGLKREREALQEVGAKKAAAAVQRAIKSAEGARRHILRLVLRQKYGKDV